MQSIPVDWFLYDGKIGFNWIQLFADSVIPFQVTVAVHIEITHLIYVLVSLLLNLKIATGFSKYVQPFNGYQTLKI